MPTNIPVKNTNQRHQLKVVSETSDIEEKTKKVFWKQGMVTYLKPGEQTDLWVAEGRRYTITEMPT